MWYEEIEFRCKRLRLHESISGRHLGRHHNSCSIRLTKWMYSKLRSCILTAHHWSSTINSFSKEMSVFKIRLRLPCSWFKWRHSNEPLSCYCCPTADKLTRHCVYNLKDLYSCISFCKDFLVSWVILLLICSYIHPLECIFSSLSPHYSMFNVKFSIGFLWEVFYWGCWQPNM